MTQNTIVAALRQCAVRHSRASHEADDLVQDVLLMAVAKGRKITDPDFVAWARGAIRNHARFTARTAARRRARETAWEASVATPGMPARFSPAFISSLPPAQRVLSLLINLELGRAEITHLLGLSDTAFRQRLSGLRKAFLVFGDDATDIGGFPSLAGDGPARRALKSILRPHAPRVFAIRDPDGIPIFFSKRDHVLPGGGN